MKEQKLNPITCNKSLTYFLQSANVLCFLSSNNHNYSCPLILVTVTFVNSPKTGIFYPSVSAQEINFITYLQRPKKQDKWLSPDWKPVTAATQASTVDSHRALCCQICHVCIKQCNRAVRQRNYLLTCAPPLLKFVARLRFWSSSVSTFRAFQKLRWGAEDLPAVTWYMMDSTETFCSTSLIIIQHGIRYHQYADDTQLHLAMSVDNTAAGLADLAACTADVKQWYLQNGLQLNPDKSEALVVGTANQLCVVNSSVSSVSVAGVDLPVAVWRC